MTRLICSGSPIWSTYQIPFLLFKVSETSSLTSNSPPIQTQRLIVIPIPLQIGTTSINLHLLPPKFQSIFAQLAFCNWNLGIRIGCPPWRSTKSQTHSWHSEYSKLWYVQESPFKFQHLLSLFIFNSHFFFIYWWWLINYTGTFGNSYSKLLGCS